MRPSLETVELTDSTNAQLLHAQGDKQAVSLSIDGLVSARSLLAYEQMAGRGRRNTVWNASAGASVCLSISQDWLDPSRALSAKATTLSLCLGVVAKECLDRCLPRPRLALKWPNDVLLLDPQGTPYGKIAGMLIEARALSNGCWRVVVGIGVNLWAEGIKPTALVPLDALGPRRMLVAGLFDHEAMPGLAKRRERVVQVATTLAQELHAGLREGLQLGWSAFEARYVQSDCLIGRGVTIYDQQTPSASYEAEVLGVAPDGGLLVQYGLEKRIIYAADVSIRVSQPKA